MTLKIILCLLVLLAVGACYDSPSVTIRVPGEYKGAVDPLLAKQRMPQQQEILKDRLLLIQTDR